MSCARRSSTTRVVVRLVILVAAALSSLAGGETRRGAHFAVGAKANELIAMVVDVYRTAKSYRDTGTIIAYDAYGESERDHVTFKTAFVRPDRFRFEWREPWPIDGSVRRVVWSDGREARTWWQVPLGDDLDEIEPSLDLAIAGATGVSRGTAHTIPSLLLAPHVEGRSLKDMIRPRIERDTTLGERRVWVVAGLYGSCLLRVFVDQQTLLVLRVDESQSEDHGLLDSTTTYQPELDPKITESELTRGWTSRK